jgi:hypothetical protein
LLDAAPAPEQATMSRGISRICRIARARKYTSAASDWNCNLPRVSGTSCSPTLCRSPDSTTCVRPLTTWTLDWPTQYRSQVFHSPSGRSIAAALTTLLVVPEIIGAPGA